jgi:hypothetical protein
VAEGKLDERLVSAPSVVQLRVAYLFGTAALVVGIVLAVFIFWALLSGMTH